MRFKVAAACSIASWLVVSIAAAQSQPSFKSSVDLVRVTATVTTDGGPRQVAGLTQDDFLILDGGREQPIVSFSAERQPVSVIFLLDISASMKGRAHEHSRQAVYTFVRNHFGPLDEALVCVFNTRTTCANRWSRDADALAAALAPIAPTGATRVLDAVPSALELFRDARHRKQVLVVLSDGKDVNSKRSPRDVASIMRESDVLMYAIAFPMSDLTQLVVPFGRLPGEMLVDLPLLRGLTNPSGGATFHVTSAERIGDAVSRIVDELGNQYLLGYELPPGRSGYREIEVKLRSMRHDVRARRGYFVPAPD